MFDPGVYRSTTSGAPLSRQLEHKEQKTVVFFLRAAGILFAAIPNGARTSIGTARKLKMEGLQAGAPDLLIFDPPPDRKFVGVAIEMKRGDRKGRVSKEQDQWLTALFNRGWYTAVCHGAPEALTLLAKLGYNRMPTSHGKGT